MCRSGLVRSFSRKVMANYKKKNCTWSFKSAKIVQNEVKAVGHCSFCFATLKANSSENLGKLHVLITNWKDVSHESARKRNITGSKRDAIKSKMNGKSALVIQAELANEYMCKGDAIPSHLPHLNTLRRMKYESKLKDIHHKCPIMSLKAMKDESEFHKERLSDIGLDPFYLFYSTPLQNDWYNCEARKKGNSTVISIDATGLNLKIPSNASISELTGKPKNIFLYVITTHSSQDKAIPVFQVLSQRHTMEFITYFLKCWTKNVTKLPNEIIVDDSAALLGASVLVFTKFHSTHEYLDECFSRLSSNTCDTNTSSYIRLDRSHFVKAIHRNKFIKKESLRTQQFYKSIIGVLIICDDYQAAVHIIKTTFVVLLNSNLDGHLVNNAITTLKQICSTHDLSYIIADLNNNDNCLQDDFSTDTESSTSNDVMCLHDVNKDKLPTPKNKFHSMIIDILKQTEIVDDSCPEAIENPFYAPHMRNTILHLFSRLPLWSNVMNRYFQSKNVCATSSASENEFKNIKHLIMDDKGSIRIDRFVQDHLAFLEGHLKIALAKQLDKSSEIDSEQNRGNNSSDEEENWMGKNSDILEKNYRRKNKAKKKLTASKVRAKYSILNPALHLNGLQCVVPILKNGYTHRAKGSVMITNQTCSFDSIFQIYLSLYLDMEQIKREIDCAEISNFKKLIIACASGNIHETKTRNEIYALRNKLLFDIFSKPALDFADNPVVEVFENNIQRLDCETSVYSMFYHLFKSNVAMFKSIDTIINCAVCQKVISTTALPVIDIMLTKESLSDLQAFLDVNKKQSRNRECIECTNALSVQREYGNIIAFEVGSFPGENINISEISQNVILNSKTYELRGIVEHQFASKHFISHIKRKNSTWETHNDLKPNAVGTTPTAVNIPQLLFYVLLENADIDNPSVVNNDAKLLREQAYALLKDAIYALCEARRKKLTSQCSLASNDVDESYETSNVINILGSASIGEIYDKIDEIFTETNKVIDDVIKLNKAEVDAYDTPNDGKSRQQTKVHKEIDKSVAGSQNNKTDEYEKNNPKNDINDVVMNGLGEPNEVKIHNENNVLLSENTERTATRLNLEKPGNLDKGMEVGPTHEKKIKSRAPLPFHSLSRKEKINKIIFWILEESSLNGLDTDVIDETTLSSNLAAIQNNRYLRLFEDVSLNIIENRLSHDAWISLKSFEETHKNDKWQCQICLRFLKSNQKMVQCDSCLLWFHRKCCPHLTKPASRLHNFFCNTCILLGY